MTANGEGAGASGGKAGAALSRCRDGVPVSGRTGFGRWLDHTPIARNGRCNSRDARIASRYARRAGQPLAPGAGDTHRIAIPRARGPGAETAGSWASVKRGPQAQRTVDLACSAARSPGNGDRVGVEVVRRQVEPCACRPDWETRRRGAVATGPASVTMRLTLEVAAQVGGPRSIRCPGWRTLPAPDDPSRLVATRDGTGRPARPDAPTPPHG